MNNKLIAGIVILSIASYFSWIPLLIGLAIRRFTDFFSEKNYSIYRPGVYEFGLAMTMCGSIGLVVLGFIIWAILAVFGIA